jgi:SAM-dependent methyltransferase
MLSGKVAFSDAKYSCSREKLQPFKTKMVDLVKEQSPGRVLDIGCGSGVVSKMLREAGWEVYGTDISLEGIRRYRGRGLFGVVSDAEKPLPFCDRSFDAVWLTEVIEHLMDYRRMVQEIRRILKPGGRIYVTAPNSVFYGYRLLYLLGKCPTELQHPFHIRFFSPGFLCRTLRENGFRIEKSMGHNVYLMLPRFLYRPGGTGLRALICRTLRMLGFKEVEGLIHGDKMLLSGFSSFLPGFFSNAIMIVAQRPAPLGGET